MLSISNNNLEPQIKLRLRIELVIYLAICVALIFIPLFKAGWVYDDVNLVQPSPALENIEGLGHSISTDLYSQANSRLEVSSYWRPLAMASYWFNTRFGDAPSALHVGNILIQALAAALLGFLIMRRHSGMAGLIAALLAAAWWALHPQNVEPVAWISCRYDLLCGLALLGLLLVPWRSGPLRAMFFGIIFLAGLLAKENFGAMAAVILAIDFAYRRPVRESALRWTAIGIALGIWMCLRNIIGIKSLDLPTFKSVLNIIGSYLEAISLYSWRALGFPALTISHPYTSVNVLWVGAGVIILAVLITAVYFKRRLAVPVTIFLAGLVPIAGAMTMFHEAPERYFYIPSIGLALLLGELLVFIFSVRYKFIRIAIPILIGIALILGIIKLEQRLPEWRNDDKLWAAAIRVSPLDPLANQNRAIAASRRSDWEGALKAIKISAKGDPDSAKIAITYAWILLKTGDNVGAVKEAQRAAAIAPYQPDGWYYLAFASHKIGDHTGELAALEKLLQIAPNYPGAQAMLKAAKGEVDEQKN